VQLLYSMAAAAAAEEIVLVRHPRLLVARVLFASLPGQPPPPAAVAALPATACVRAWAAYDDEVWVALITARRAAGHVPLGTAYVVVLEHARCGYASSLTVRLRTCTQVGMHTSTHTHNTHTNVLTLHGLGQDGAGVTYRSAVRQWRQLPGPVADGPDAGPYVLGVSAPRGMIVALCPAGPTVPVTATTLDVNADDEADGGSEAMNT
jgi:hypothetical protein